MASEVIEETAGPPGRLLRVDEAAKILGISRAHLYTRVSSGALKSVRIGASRRISEKSLNAFIEHLEAANDN